MAARWIIKIGNGSTIIGLSLKRDRQLQWQIRQELGGLKLSHRDRQGITETSTPRHKLTDP